MNKTEASNNTRQCIIRFSWYYVDVKLSANESNLLNTVMQVTTTLISSTVAPDCWTSYTWTTDIEQTKLRKAKFEVSSIMQLEFIKLDGGGVRWGMIREVEMQYI